MVTTRFYLDIRYTKPGCPCPVKLVFNLNNKRALMLTGISLLPSQWDDKRQQAVCHPQKNQLNTMLAERKVDVDRLLYSLGLAGELNGLKVADIKNRVAAELCPTAPPEPKGVKFVKRFDEFVAQKSAGTRRVYGMTRSRLESILGKEALERLTFEQMDRAWLKDFDARLALTSPSRNARNIHLRNIRAVFNDALADEVITCYPFRKLKITPEATRKRALSREQFEALMNLRLEPWEERYRDCFKLIFALQGINIVDLCGLEGLANGRVEYRRAKTHRLYSVLVADEARALLERYKGETHLLNYLDTCKSYRTFYSRMCGALRSMGSRIGVEGLSTYWARHTWATFAASLDVPKETIAHALGHGGYSVTDIYIDFDQRKADQANLQVMALARELGF